MLSILTTTENRDLINEALASVDRLQELVSVTTNPAELKEIKSLIVEGDSILTPFDWYDLEPPYIIPAVDFSRDNLLALVFYKLGNHQKAFEYLEEGTELFHHMLAASQLQYGYEISEEMLAFAKSTSLHNLAILMYYGNYEVKENEALAEAFSKAFDEADNDELKIYTLKHYLNLLLDREELQKGISLIDQFERLAISEDAGFALDLQLATFLKQKLELPYQKDELDRILALQMAAIEKFEAKELKVQAGLRLMEAAEIANFKSDFIAAKEWINKAIQYFKEEDIPEFLGEAALKKAILLYTWSKNGSPQYYKAAINAFQDVLKVFKRDTHPQKFAEIHHNLALIYSEIPVSEEEKAMWTAFSASSFKEALNFYNREHYPYEHAMVSHNYATALLSFPPAKLHDNLTKADELFEKALEVRTAEAYPFERALTLLNQLELAWLTHNENQDEELRKLSEMKAKAEEVKTLVTDLVLVEKAEDHLSKLEKIKTLI